MSLFRRQAIDEQKDRLYGEVIITQPISFYFISFIFLVIVCSILLMLVYGSYSRRETVAGYLVPDKGLVKIYAPIPGILSVLHVEDGQTVKKGDVLVTVSTLQTNDQGGDKDSLILDELKNQKLNLLNKIKQEKAIYKTKVNTLSQQFVGITRELKQLNASLVLEKKRLALSYIKITKLKELLSEGHISKNTLDIAEQLHLEFQVQIQGSQLKIIQAESRYNDNKQKQKEIPLEWKSLKTDFNRSLSEIVRSLVEISGRRVYTIQAPVSGKLTALQYLVGQYLSAQAPIISILPSGTSMQAELFLPTRASGFIVKNQKVLLRYDAYPYQHYGMYQGKVTNIAQTILSPNELPIPIVLQEPVYRVKVLLDNQFIQAYGKSFPLQAGMLLEADIILENRTLGQWLFEPIYGLRGKL